MKTSLQDWLKNGWLNEHKTSRQEIAGLFGVADRDIAACRTPGLVNDWRFNLRRQSRKLWLLLGG